MEAVFEDWRTAPVREELRAALGMVEALTLRPKEFGPDQIRPLREAGLDDAAIGQVAVICSMFNVIVRLADSLEFEVPTEEQFAAIAPRMLARGYR